MLSQPFQELLEQLVSMDELDPRVLKAQSIEELSAILQKPQGYLGGFMRQEGTERWHLKDSPTMQKHQRELECLLEKLGFINPTCLEQPLMVDHCILFGARTERMEARIKATVSYLQRNLSVNGNIYLLGANRKLIPEEIALLKQRIESLNENQKTFWLQELDDADQCTETTAFMCLWECLVPLELQERMNPRLIRADSMRIGNSYGKTHGHRVTMEVTADDWMYYYQEGKPQILFAVVEQPFMRLQDQLMFTVLTRGKKANLAEISKRAAEATFYFASVAPDEPPLISVVLDEIARHVYRVNEVLKYLEG